MNSSRVHGITLYFFAYRCITRIFFYQIWIDIFEFFEISTDSVENYDIQKAFCWEITKSWTEVACTGSYFTFLSQIHYQDILLSNLNRYLWVVRNFCGLSRELWFSESFLVWNYKIMNRSRVHGIILYFFVTDALPGYFIIKFE